MLEVRFLEASRNAVREIGFGSTIDANDVTAVTESSTVSGLLEKTVATFTNVGGENIDIRLRALEEKGIIRTLAEPNLVALSGDTASFLAGGEFPIPVAQRDNEISVEFKKFGVSLDFTPTVLGDGLVNIRVRPEVSALDRNNGIRASAIDIPGISVRRADTTVELHDGQAFAIAGLLQNNYSNDVRQTPWLGNVPVLGSLFSSKRYQRNETELVIIVTPRLVQPFSNPEAVSSPLDAVAEPTESVFFLLGKTVGALPAETGN
jgi:pilus assembly protein CpaC